MAANRRQTQERTRTLTHQRVRHPANMLLKPRVGQRVRVRSICPVLLVISGTFGLPAAAQKTATPQNPQASGATQPPGGPQDNGGPIVIVEGQNVATTTGVQTQVFATILDRTPADPEHATDPQTGRNFNWDSTTNRWINSQTGQVAGSSPWWYLSKTQPSAPLTSTPTPAPLTPPANTPAPTTSTTPPAQPQTAAGTPRRRRSGVFLAGRDTPLNFRFRGFGGTSFINGNTPPTAGFDGAVLFPLGNRILVGPTAGFQWVNSSIVQTIGGGPPPSTFIHTSVGFKNGNFGGTIDFIPCLNVPHYPNETMRLVAMDTDIGIHGGATVAGSTITQATGFCSGTGGSLPPGCTVLSTTTTQDTVTGSFVGGYISHSIFSHVGIFVGYDYHLLKVTKPNATNPSGPPILLSSHYSDLRAGLVLTFGRHAAK